MAHIPAPRPTVHDLPTARRTWRSVIVALIAANALVAVCRVQTRDDPHMDDGVQRLISAYALIVPLVPAEGRLALLSFESDAAETARIRLIAQHGLAPRILHSDPANATHLVTTPHATEHVGSDDRLAGYGVVAGFDQGIRLYRRLP